MFTNLILLQTVVNPELAVKNIVENGIVGSMFIVTLVVLIWVVKSVKGALVSFFEKLNDERIRKENEAQDRDNEYIEYLKTSNSKLTEIVAKNSEVILQNTTALQKNTETTEQMKITNKILIEKLKECNKPIS